MQPSPPSVHSGSNSVFPAISNDMTSHSAPSNVNSRPVVQECQPAYPVFFSETSKKLDDFYINGVVPEDKYIQGGIAKKYLVDRTPDKLSDFLTKNKIDNLMLSNRQLNDEDAKILANVLKSNKTLLQVELCQNKFGSEGLKIVCESLEENSTLIALDLSENEVQGSLYVEALGKMIAKNRTLEILKLNFTGIGPEEMPVLARALEKNQTLTELHLVGNSFGNKGVEALSELLKINSSLKIMDLSCNGISSECGRLIADGLKKNTALSKLNLANNSLGSDGATPILNALGGNASLKNLGLAYNGLDKDSAKPIASLLQKNRSLSSLNFSDNRIFVSDKTMDSEAIDAIFNGLESNNVVNDLNLTANHSSFGRINNLNLTANESIIGRIDNLLERNRTLDSLSGKDAYLFSQLVPGQRLSLDEGKLLASATIMASPSVMAYEATMVEIQCALNVLAVQV